MAHADFVDGHLNLNSPLNCQLQKPAKDASLFLTHSASESRPTQLRTLHSICKTISNFVSQTHDENTKKVQSLDSYIFHKL